MLLQQKKWLYNFEKNYFIMIYFNAIYKCNTHLNHLIILLAEKMGVSVSKKRKESALLHHFSQGVAMSVCLSGCLPGCLFAPLGAVFVNMRKKKNWQKKDKKKNQKKKKKMVTRESGIK